MSVETKDLAAALAEKMPELRGTARVEPAFGALHLVSRRRPGAKSCSARRTRPISPIF